MASRKAKAPAPGPAVEDELGELFDGINKTKPKPKPAAKGKTSAKKKATEQEKDILADLENELSAQPPSRPHTPKVKDGVVGVKGSPVTASAVAAKRTSASTGVASATRTDARQSTDSARSYHVAMTSSGTRSDTPESERKPVDKPNPASGGGWWGGIFATASATASAAIKQAEGVVTNIQSSEEAKRWTEQVRGNVANLRGISDELRTRAMPTFTTFLHTLAPPISQHELLRIHITHDMVGYPSLDPLIYATFSRVMSQVEGGDLMVIQRGQEATARRSIDGASQAGWRDGPWWRASDVPRDMGIVRGLPEGTKLCRVSAESYSLEYYASRGGIEEARRLAHEPASESNPVRTSDIFLAVQAISPDPEDEEELFEGSASNKAEEEESAATAHDQEDPMVSFAVYLLDPVHEITFGTVSQSLPAKWIRWLDTTTPLTPLSGEEGASDQVERSGVPAEILDIIESGGVDPREWVSEWVEEAIDLSIGVIAQRYVARRMGVGEGGIGKGKQRAEVVMGEGGGEAARAGLI